MSLHNQAHHQTYNIVYSALYTVHCIFILVSPWKKHLRTSLRPIETMIVLKVVWSAAEMSFNPKSIFHFQDQNAAASFLALDIWMQHLLSFSQTTSAFQHSRNLKTCTCDSKNPHRELLWIGYNWIEISQHEKGD